MAEALDGLSEDLAQVVDILHTALHSKGNRELLSSQNYSQATVGMQLGSPEETKEIFGIGNIVKGVTIIHGNGKKEKLLHPLRQVVVGPEDNIFPYRAQVPLERRMVTFPSDEPKVIYHNLFLLFNLRVYNEDSNGFVCEIRTLPSYYSLHPDLKTAPEGEPLNRKKEPDILSFHVTDKHTLKYSVKGKETAEGSVPINLSWLTMKLCEIYDKAVGMARPLLREP